MRNISLSLPCILSSSVLWSALILMIYCETSVAGSAKDDKERRRRFNTTRIADLLNSSGENHTNVSFNMRQKENTTISEGNFTRNIHTTPSRSDLPLPIIIASPAVAIGIVIFICVAYKWHTHQLDTQAKELAEQMAANCPSPCMPCSPCHNTHRLLPPSPSISPVSPSHSDADLIGTRRKSMLSSSPSTLSPPGFGNKRGSSWSALSDQELLSHSPRRHSTFLL